MNANVNKEKWWIHKQTAHRGPENLKKSMPKKLVKSNESISGNFFLTKFHFLQFQKYGQKTIFELEKSLKTVRHAILRKK